MYYDVTDVQCGVPCVYLWKTSDKTHFSEPVAIKTKTCGFALRVVVQCGSVELNKF